MHVKINERTEYLRFSWHSQKGLTLTTSARGGSRIPIPQQF